MAISKLYSCIRSALAGNRGAAMIEYALLVGLIAVVAMGTISTLGTNVNGKFTAISNGI